MFEEKSVKKVTQILINSQTRFRHKTRFDQTLVTFNGIVVEMSYFVAKTNSFRRKRSDGSEWFRHRYSAICRAGNSVSQT